MISRSPPPFNFVDISIILAFDYQWIHQSYRMCLIPPVNHLQCVSVEMQLIIELPPLPFPVPPNLPVKSVLVFLNLLPGQLMKLRIDVDHFEPRLHRLIAFVYLLATI